MYRRKGRHDPFSPANEEEDVKARDAETAAESEAGEAEADDVEEDETKELRRNGEAEAPTGAAQPVRATPPIAAAEILPERKERDAIGEASASAMVGGVKVLRANHSLVLCVSFIFLSATTTG